MKRRLFLIIILFPVLLLLTTGAHAEEYTYRADELGEYAARLRWDELMSEIPPDISSELGTYDLSSVSPSQIGEKTKISFWLTEAYEVLVSSVSDLFPDISVLITVIILTAVAKASLPHLSESLSDAFLMIGRVAVAVLLVRCTYNAIETAGGYLREICTLMNLISPVMEALYLSEGAVTEAAVSTTGITVAVTLIGNINTYLMTPIVSVLFTLSSLTSICGDVKLGGFTSSVRKLLMRLWQILTLLFSFMIGTQSVIARSADTLATRTARFAISSMVPVAGGIISEAYNTLREGVSYMKATAGIGGIIVVLLILLSGIIPLLVYKAAFGITSYASGMLRLDETSKLLDEIKQIMDLIIAIVLYTSLMLVFALVLFTKSREG